MENFKNYAEVINGLRQKELTDEVLDEYAKLPTFFTRTLVGENLLEASFALRDKEPEIASILQKLGTSFLELVNKEITVEEKFKKALKEDPALQKLLGLNNEE